MKTGTRTIICALLIICQSVSTIHGTDSKTPNQDLTPESLGITYDLKWFLEIFQDGSAVLQYGSSIGHQARLTPGTFDIDELEKAILPGLTEERPNRPGPYVQVVLSSSDSSRTARYLSNEPLIQNIFEQALSALSPQDVSRLGTVLDKYPLPVRSSADM